jgi:hypothetical protein
MAAQAVVEAEPLPLLPVVPMSVQGAVTLEALARSNQVRRKVEVAEGLVR